jgi:hypothetical protein
MEYFDFVRNQVMEYTRPSGELGLARSLKFFWFMIRNGLRMTTAAAIARQLVTERFGAARWRRATILDRLQFDLFRHYYRVQRPDVCTFFLNSTAHFQHVYWRNMDPQAFALQPSDVEQKALQGAVLYGYQSMDRIVGETLGLADSDTVVVLASALGQQPCLTYESTGGKSFYKPESYADLLRFAGIDSNSCSAEPVMSEEFHLRFASDALAKDAIERLKPITVLGRPVLNLRQDGASVMAGCGVYSELPPDAEVKVAGAKATAFRRLFYFVDTKKSGMHHPDGIFWVALPGARSVVLPEPRRANLVDAAPTLLKILGLPKPKEMSGRALVEV